MGRSNRKKSSAEDKVPQHKRRDSRDVLEQSNWRERKVSDPLDPLPRKSSSRNSPPREREDISWKNRRMNRRTSVPVPKGKSRANSRRYSAPSINRVSPSTTLTSDFTKPDWKTAMIIAVQESQNKPVVVPDWLVKAIMR